MFTDKNYPQITTLEP